MKKFNHYMGYLTVLIFLCLGALFLQWKTVFAAATPVTINTVDYEEENLIVNNNGNTRIYFATEMDASRGNWEVINADPGDTTVIDFSWVSPSTENIIEIKGEEDGTTKRVILVERTKKLEISISYSLISQLAKTDTIAPLLNIMSTSGTASEPITFDDLEWRKGEGGKWKDINELTKEQLEKFQIKGTSLYFRIKAVNDASTTTYNPDGTNGRRFSNEVKLKINKKLTAMVIGIDGEEFTADIKYGKEYRVTIDGTRTKWIKVTNRGIKKLPLSTIFNDGSDGTTANKAFPAALIEIRDYATSRTAASKITEISLEAQRILTLPIVEGNAPENASATDPNIYLSYNGISNMVVTIPSASTKLPYEYCIVKPGDYFDLENVIWSTVTKNTPVKILGSKAIEGSTIYIRQAEIKSRAATRNTPAVAYALASTYVTHKVNYPSIPNIIDTTYTFIKGYSEDITFHIKLNVLGKKPYETAIKNIKIGTKEIEFTSSVSPSVTSGVNENTVYTMTVTLKKTSLETMANSFNKLIAITFTNGTIDKNSIKLTIQNPAPALSLSATVAKGSATGTTAVTVTSILGSGNKLVYTIDGSEVKNKTMEDIVVGGMTFTSGTDITITANQFLTVYEVNAVTNKIVKMKSIQITADKIK